MKNERKYYAHDSAYIDEPCVIGVGTRIWHFAHVMRDSTIGEGCNLGQNVVVSPGCVIGNNVKIQNNVSVYTGVILDDDVFCGPSMVFTNVMNPRSHVPRKDEFKRTWVRTGATIGANATVVCGVTVGRYAFIGAGAVVTKDVPDFGVAYGNPARCRGWVCYCGAKLGLKLREPERQSTTCGMCGRGYSREGFTVMEAIGKPGNQESIDRPPRVLEHDVRRGA